MTNIVFFGHHKCASSWMSNIFYEIQSVTGWSIHYGIDPSKKINVIGEATAECVKNYSDFRGVHLVRDPRDVVISGYYSHLNTHPTGKRPDILAFRNKIKDRPTDQGIKMEMDFSSERLHEMEKWDYSNPNILELKFEQFTQKPNWTELFNFLGLKGAENHIEYVVKRTLNKLSNRGLSPFRFNNLKVPMDVLDKIPERMSFDKLTGGRKPGESDLKSHYRKGTPGDWHKHFSSNHKDYFKLKFPALLETLGYENDNNW
jgi:hypothetical protein